MIWRVEFISIRLRIYSSKFCGAVRRESVFEIKGGHMKINIGLVIGFSLLIITMSTDVGGQQSSNAPQPLIVGTKEAPPLLHEDRRRPMDRPEH